MAKKRKFFTPEDALLQHEKSFPMKAVRIFWNIFWNIFMRLETLKPLKPTLSWF